MGLCPNKPILSWKYSTLKIYLIHVAYQTSYHSLTCLKPGQTLIFAHNWAKSPGNTKPCRVSVVYPPNPVADWEMWLATPAQCHRRILNHFLLNAYHRCMIIKFKNSKLNHPKSGTVCTNWYHRNSNFKKYSHSMHLVLSIHFYSDAWKKPTCYWLDSKKQSKTRNICLDPVPFPPKLCHASQVKGPLWTSVIQLYNRDEKNLTGSDNQN